MTPPQIFSLAPCDNDTLHQMLDARLNYAHHLAQAPPQSLMIIDESAYHALFALAQGNPGYMFYTFRRVLSSDQVRQSKERPYVVDADDIREASTSLESYQAWQDSPLKRAVVLDVERGGLRSTDLEDKLIREFGKNSE